MSDSAGRNPGIDLLRGMSIVLVVIHHVGLRIHLKETMLADLLPLRVLDALVFNGYESVFVFFVISGFLIATHAISRWSALREIDLGAFYLRRAARILPSLFALVVVLSVLHVLGAQDYVIDSSRQSLPRAIGAALGLHLNWYEGHTGYLPGGWDVLWSLSIEEVFYLGFPLLCVLIRRDWLLALLIAPLALSLPATHAALAGNEIWQEKAYLPGMSAIAAGVVAALLVAHAAKPREWFVAVLQAAGIMGLISVFIFGDLVWKRIADGYLLVLTLSVACLVVGLHWHRQQRPWRMTAWLRACGRLSYEIYLTHMFVVFALVRVFRAIGDPRWGFVCYVPAVAASWALGALVAHYFSQPAERKLRRSQ